MAPETIPSDPTDQKRDDSTRRIALPKVHSQQNELKYLGLLFGSLISAVIDHGASRSRLDKKSFIEGVRNFQRDHSPNGKYKTHPIRINLSYEELCRLVGQKNLGPTRQDLLTLSCLCSKLCNTAADHRPKTLKDLKQVFICNGPMKGNQSNVSVHQVETIPQLMQKFLKYILGKGSQFHETVDRGGYAVPALNVKKLPELWESFQNQAEVRNFIRTFQQKHSTVLTKFDSSKFLPILLKASGEKDFSSPLIPLDNILLAEREYNAKPSPRRAVIKITNQMMQRSQAALSQYLKDSNTFEGRIAEKIQNLTQGDAQKSLINTINEISDLAVLANGQKGTFDSGTFEKKLNNAYGSFQKASDLLKDHADKTLMAEVVTEIGGMIRDMALMMLFDLAAGALITPTGGASGAAGTIVTEASMVALSARGLKIGSTVEKILLGTARAGVGAAGYTGFGSLQRLVRGEKISLDTFCDDLLVKGLPTFSGSLGGQIAGSFGGRFIAQRGLTREAWEAMAPDKRPIFVIGEGGLVTSFVRNSTDIFVDASFGTASHVVDQLVLGKNPQDVFEEAIRGAIGGVAAGALLRGAGAGGRHLAKRIANRSVTEPDLDILWMSPSKLKDAYAKIRCEQIQKESKHSGKPLSPEQAMQKAQQEALSVNSFVRADGKIAVPLQTVKREDLPQITATLIHEATQRNLTAKGVTPLEAQVRSYLAQAKYLAAHGFELVFTKQGARVRKVDEGKIPAVPSVKQLYAFVNGAYSKSELNPAAVGSRELDNGNATASETLDPEEILIGLAKNSEFLPTTSQVEAMLKKFQAEKFSWNNRTYHGGALPLFVSHDLKGDPFYEIFTTEYIESFANYLEKRAIEENASAKAPLVILETCAGSGKLSEFLRREFSKRGNDRIKVIATDDYTWALEKPFDVKQMSAEEAVKNYPADIVITSWMPYGVDLTPTYRAQGRVKEYVLIGEVSGCTGSASTWGNGMEHKPYEKDGFYRRDLDLGLQYCMLDRPDEEWKFATHSSTVSFIRKGDFDKNATNPEQEWWSKPHPATLKRRREREEFLREHRLKEIKREKTLAAYAQYKAERKKEQTSLRTDAVDNTKFEFAKWDPSEDKNFIQSEQNLSKLDWAKRSYHSMDSYCRDWVDYNCLREVNVENILNLVALIRDAKEILRKTGRLPEKLEEIAHGLSKSPRLIFNNKPVRSHGRLVSQPPTIIEDGELAYSLAVKINKEIDLNENRSQRFNRWDEEDVTRFAAPKN